MKLELNRQNNKVLTLKFCTPTYETPTGGDAQWHPGGVVLQVPRLISPPGARSLVARSLLQQCDWQLIFRVMSWNSPTAIGKKSCGQVKGH